MSVPELHGSLDVTWPKTMPKDKAKRLVNKAIRGNSNFDDSDLKAIFLRDYESGDGMYIEISEMYNSSFEDALLEMVDDLGPKGIKLTGEVSAYGDDDWFWDVRDNSVSSYDKTDEGLVYASDETLIDMLRKRGYTVTKKGKRKK